MTALSAIADRIAAMYRSAERDVLLSADFAAAISATGTGVLPFR